MKPWLRFLIREQLNPNLTIILFGQCIADRIMIISHLNELIGTVIENPDTSHMYIDTLNAMSPRSGYEIPFDAYSCFGKRKDINSDGTRAKKLLTWINYDPVSLVNCIQADFMERTQSRVGEVRNKKGMHLKANSIYGKPYEKEVYGVPGALSDCSTNSEASLQQKYLQHINTLRQRLKHRVPETPFLDIYEDLCSLDKKYTDLLPENKVFDILAKHKIYVEKRNFVPLLDVLGIRQEGNVNYRKLVNLLNWKCDFPTLPKINKTPSACLYYKTTYGETVGNAKEIDTSNIRAAGVPSTRWDLPYITVPRDGIRADKENLGDQTSAYSLLFPSIFTRSGLSHIDFFKIRGKDEIKSIFENAGIRFPDNCFDLLWEEGLTKDCANGVCVETFKTLLEQSPSIVTETD